MNKKIKYILLVIILILVFLIIRSTYSKYMSASEATIDEKIAQWVIKVNDTDITVNNTSGVTFDITGSDIVWDDNSLVKDGKIAPGMKGHFYLRIDPEKTQTALKYTININMEEMLNDHIKFIITDIKDDNGKTLQIKRDGVNATIQKIKELSEIKNSNQTIRTEKIRVDIEWVSEEDYDRFDTKVGETYDKVFIIPVTINAIQYTGEGYDF